MSNYPNNNNGSQQKRWTPCDMYRVITKSGMEEVLANLQSEQPNPQFAATSLLKAVSVGITVEGLVTRYEGVKQVRGDKVVASFRIPVYGRTDYIEKMCGCRPAEDPNGTVWVQVSFWQPITAETGPVSRLDKLIQNNQNRGLVLNVTGIISVTGDTDKAGNYYVNTNISGNNFWVVRSYERRNNGGQYGDQPSAPQQGWGQKPSADPQMPSAPQQSWGQQSPDTPQPAPASQQGWGNPAPPQSAPDPQQGWGNPAPPQSAPDPQQSWGNPAPPQSTPNPQQSWGNQAPAPQQNGQIPSGSGGNFFDVNVGPDELPF